jgi:lipoate-protein ligase A
MAPFYFLKLEALAIFEQLQIEEALVRADDRNWVIVNRGSAPAIVMGISGKQALHINADRMQAAPIPVIRRFSGGGTVVVDKQTHFYTLIGNRSLFDFPCHPERLMRWTENLYAPAFEALNFSLRDHDYVIQDHKFGGNAQYLSKDRWLHHSSLLWDYEEQMMEYLLLPPKMPAYRNARCHTAFLCRLADFFASRDHFSAQMLQALQRQLTLIPTTLDAIAPLLQRPHRRMTKFETA